MAKKKRQKKSKSSKKRVNHRTMGLPKGIKRVCLVGKGEGRGLAPRAPAIGYEVWGTNNVALQQRVDMIWDMHDLDWTIEENRAQYAHLAKRISQEEIEFRVQLRDIGFKKLKEYVRETNTPIMSVKQYADLPPNLSLEYPLEKIIEKFDCDLFSSVIPYMIAYAIYKKYTHIDIYGINCAHYEEWSEQRDAVWGWAQRAVGMGIKVTFTGGSRRPGRLADGILYGYGIPQKERGWKTTDKWYEPKDQIRAARGLYDPMKEKDDLVLREFDVWKEST